MAATLTPDDELTRVAFANIEKWEEDPDDGTLYVYGRATTPEVDTDDQVVSSAWSGSALKAWLDEAPALRVQHNSQRDPAGSGVKVEVNRDGDGAHWVKAAVDEPVAQRLVKRGHLRAFSVGIAKPVIERDMTGKARGGIINGGRIVEVSLVDSPANRSCFLELAKAAKDGHAEWSGKVFGGDDLLTKAAHDDDGTVTVDVPKGRVDLVLPVGPAEAPGPPGAGRAAGRRRPQGDHGSRGRRLEAGHRHGDPPPPRQPGTGPPEPVLPDRNARGRGQRGHPRPVGSRERQRGEEADQADRPQGRVAGHLGPARRQDQRRRGEGGQVRHLPRLGEDHGRQPGLPRLRRAR